MKNKLKYSLMSLITASVLMPSIILANDTNSTIEEDSSNIKNYSVLINTDSEAGKYILKSEEDYKDYLKKKAEQSKNNQIMADKVSKNCEDIQLLKKGVVKLIIELNNLKKEKLELEKDILKNKKNDINNGVHKDNRKSIDIDNIIVKQNNIDKSINNNQLIDKEVCSNEEIKVIDKEELKNSYKKMEEKTFTINVKKTYIYKLPMLGQKNIGELKRGETFKSDTYTKAGWVYIKDKGWVKGYMLSPEILYQRDMNTKEDNLPYKIEKKVNCKIIKTKKGE